jgi:hypothetical protein
MSKFVALLISMIFALNTGFSVPHRDLQTDVHFQYENPHKKNNAAAESDAEGLINETQEEATEIAKKGPFFSFCTLSESNFSVDLYYTLRATPQVSHLSFILADSEQYLCFRKLLI